MKQNQKIRKKDEHLNDAQHSSFRQNSEEERGAQWEEKRIIYLI